MHNWLIDNAAPATILGAEVMMTLTIYNALRGLGCRPALAYRLAYMESPRAPTEFSLMVAARCEVVK